MPEVIGQAPCPECGSVQDVKSDKRKYYISCTECRTFTNYQSLPAKERIRKKMQSTSEPEIQEEETAPIQEAEETPVQEPEPKAKETPPQPKPTTQKRGLMSRLYHAYATMFDE